MTVTKQTRPSRTYTTDAVTRVVRIASLVGAAATTAWILVRYPAMPETVPTHFDMRGVPDAFGPKSSVLWLLGVMLVLSSLLGWLSTRPRVFNYPAEVTEQNAQAIYREGERMMVWLLVTLVALYLGMALSFFGGEGAPLVAFALVGMVVVTGGGIVRLIIAARKGTAT